MATTNVLGTVYETLLCSPGMNEVVKIEVKMDRKAILLLNSVIEAGTHPNAESQQLLNLVPADSVTKLKEFADECLSKAGLKELSDKMKQLTGK
ncbi:hypothetical protein [Mucilaginibacter aquaedulcis]|uniref:hypothetical protein n=1 Tax=Mucilaginibacter aquaedulcis TaxID=1187081 RepID=UPI0025B30FA8|nr:hypothetical protein [Mucilaginibacter aquaedulcis]MDN3548796.1 hypothetical protein [Mucilaginibacter aquaedulcis]